MAADRIVTYSDDAILTVTEVQAYLRVNKDTAYELVNSGEIPAMRIGRQFRIPFWGLKQWVARQSSAPYPWSAEERRALQASREH